MAVVTVNGITYTAAPGENLGALLAEYQLIEMPCGGQGRCGKCRVTAGGTLSPLSDFERGILPPDEINRGVRLACRTEIRGDCTVTVAPASDMQISTDGVLTLSQLSPAFSHYGAAIDIGTTTLAARLYDISGRLLAEAGRSNPQASFGADVISRIEAAVKGSDGALAAVTCGAVDTLVRELAVKSRISEREIDALVITGNTAMLHLLTVTSAEPLSHAPFAAARLFGEAIRAGTLGLTAVSDGTEVYLPPCVAAFVGADTVTALLAGGICSGTDTKLLVDIGTNGEMALWHDGRLRLCSAAAGPAFEGAGISMGMAGRPGAVDHVSVRDGKLLSHIIGETEPIGICGSGVIDAVACLLETGVIDETGFLENDPAGIVSPVVLTGSDIRMIQLAKSAIHAGIRTLLSAAGLTCEEVSELLIAGGFGSYLDIRNAGRIGLIPQELTARVRVIGNAALTGASMLLLNRELRRDCRALARNGELVDLSSNPIFAEEYMERMFF